MKKEKITVTAYITKYALTQGIILVEGTISAEYEDGYLYCKPEGWLFGEHFPKKDYFLTLVEANEDAEKRRLKKIESLKKQILKLNAQLF